MREERQICAETDVFAKSREDRARRREIADYCESDVVNTYRVLLRYELFRGRLPDGAFHASQMNLLDFIKTRGNTKLDLAAATG
ncbi:MAG: hypothetical protein ACXU89_02730, partial [Xanthobacteraceae bacterium]